jgi:dUTP pyrophosphatase
LKRVMLWTSPGAIDFDNTNRKTADTATVPFQHDASGSFWDLTAGSYLVEFNETVDTPLDVMGQVFVRSSLWRSGAVIQAGVMDSGYKGAIGAVLQTVNPHGLRLTRDAKIAQMAFHQMSENVEGYSGVYQGSVGV